MRRPAGIRFCGFGFRVSSPVLWSATTPDADGRKRRGRIADPPECVRCHPGGCLVPGVICYGPVISIRLITNRLGTPIVKGTCEVFVYNKPVTLCGGVWTGSSSNNVVTTAPGAPVLGTSCRCSLRAGPPCPPGPGPPTQYHQYHQGPAKTPIMMQALIKI